MHINLVMFWFSVFPIAELCVDNICSLFSREREREREGGKG